ncbi:MAG: adenine deaminase [Bacteroidales bacterium]|nr:adenine deaminase [Bacteroidales bacterium]
MMEYNGIVVDIVNKTRFKGKVTVDGGIIKSIEKFDNAENCYILPGFVDSHIHIESSMLSPQNFATEAVKHGTVAVVSDPHEIANVLGVDGVDYMIDDSKKSPMKFYFGAPSCVPATDFENSGARLDTYEVDELLKRDDIYFLSEMMNFLGVVKKDTEVMRKIQSAKLANKKIDGHGPGLRGIDLKKYIEAGIQTDHECFSYEEAVEKINLGMKIQIREGSAARNFDNLYKLIDDYPDMVMLCSDDLHPDDLVKGHINLLIEKSLNKGLDLFNILRAVIYNPIMHYDLSVGMLQVGDNADFVIVKDLMKLKIQKTIIDGEEVYNNGSVLIQPEKPRVLNNFYTNKVDKDSFKIEKIGTKAKVIEIIDGELVTRQSVFKLNPKERFVSSDIENDILKISVINRFSKESPSVGLVKGFNLKRGGLISSIAHDSHNIIAVGTEDDILKELVLWVQDKKGGIAIHDGNAIFGLSLPIAGIISDLTAIEAAEKYRDLNTKVKALGSQLRAPFMTLAFMSLLVIPELKIGNKGLFDVNSFCYTNMFVD